MRWAFGYRDTDMSYDSHYDDVDSILAENENETVKELYTKLKEKGNDRSGKQVTESSSTAQGSAASSDKLNIPKCFKDFFIDRAKEKGAKYESDDHRNALSDITFNIVDKNKSGIIGLNEYYRYVHHLNRCPYSRAREEFGKFDTDGSNAIDIDEFREIFKVAIYGFSDAEPKFIFDLIDPNGDGKITYDEFMTYFEQNEPDYPKSVLYKQFKKFTQDNTYMVFTEFENFYADTFEPSQDFAKDDPCWAPSNFLPQKTRAAGTTLKFAPLSSKVRGTTN